MASPVVPLTPCPQCGQPMNPVAVLLGPVCGACTRRNHQRAVKGGRP